MRLNGDNRATEVAYFRHNGPPQILPWSRVPKSGTHPQVYSAKGSHASYESAGAKPIVQKIPGVKVQIATDHASDGRDWNTSEHLDDARRQDWYGYGGAWGEVGNLEHTTGPQGPSRFKKPAPRGW